MTMMFTTVVAAFLLTHQVYSQGVDLGGGIVTRTDAKEYADLSLDVRDIRSATTAAEKLQIYERGVHAQITAGVDFSLKDMNDQLLSSSLKTPQFLFQLYGLSDLSTELTQLLEFADHSDAAIRNAIAAEHDVADVVLAQSMWIYASHLLYMGVHECDVKTQADNPDVVEGLAGSGMDEFIALWIGTDQTPGSSDGHGLYAWAQRVGATFGTADPEAKVNRQLKLLYQQGATALSLNQDCTRENTNTAPEIWSIAVQMTSQMMVPLYQWLLFTLVEDQLESAALYAEALVPQLSQCRPSLYKRLKENLIDNEIDSRKIPDIITDLQATYDCFDLSCADIGVYANKPESACSDAENRYPVLAGFSTTSDVRGPARIDHDIHQIRALVSIGFDDFAKLIYRFGRNVPLYRDSENDPFTLLSLQTLATSTDRERAGDIYKHFLAYSPSDQFYADTVITDTLDRRGRWGSGDNEKRAEAIALTAAFQIVFLETVARLHDSFRACQSTDSERGFEGTHNPLDEAAALLIGGMEGPSADGSTDVDDGQLIWNLGNRRSFQFNTANRQGVARVNNEIQDLLYAAKGEFSALDCTKLEQEVYKIETLLTVAVSQSVMQAAVESENLPKSTTPLSVVEGHVFAESLLPLVYAVLPTAGNRIARNMILDGTMIGTHVPDGAQAVADAVGEFTVSGLGLSCSVLGGNNNVEPCRNHGGRSNAESTKIVMGLVTTVVCAIGLIW